MNPVQPATGGTNGQVKKSQEEFILGAALWYAKWGWPVFPVYRPMSGKCPCHNPDCTATGKHPRTINGFNDATTDEAVIRAWWEYDFPRSNIGIRTGAVSGLVVLDEDPRHGGDESLRQLEAKYGPLPETPTALSGGGGRHFYFQHPGFHVRSRGDVLGVGLDVKGDKGSIIAPPSLHASGRLYKWAPGKSPEQVQLAPLPAWLLGLLQGSHGPEEGSPKERTRLAVQDISEGQRNVTLASLAGTMRARGMSYEGILAGLLVENQRCEIPLSETEVERIAQSYGKYPPGTVGTQESYTDRVMQSVSSANMGRTYGMSRSGGSG
jgi:hypothetical protein